MEHKMRLVDFAFNKIKSKEKIIEIRLYDEKRQMIKEGDIILFQHIETGEILKTKVIKLHIFDTFQELFNKFPNKIMGLKENDDASIMNEFYSLEDQQKYKAVGIEIELLQ